MRGQRPSWGECLFLSTLSLRRATAVTTVVVGPSSDFYPRSPCGERPTNNQPEQQEQHISIHALLAESDSGCRQPCGHPTTYFYPRSPCGERLIWIDKTQSAPNFYPRSPCGERLSVLWMVLSRPLFLSTLSLRRATVGSSSVVFVIYISIHALLAESDLSRATMAGEGGVFLSTLSLRRATPEKSE